MKNQTIALIIAAGVFAYFWKQKSDAKVTTAAAGSTAVSTVAKDTTAAGSEVVNVTTP